MNPLKHAPSALGHADTGKKNPSARKNPRTLLNKILLWIFGPLFLLWTVGIVITYFIAQHIANAPYDRTLRSQLELIQQETRSQSLLAPLYFSESARTVLRLDSASPIYWQIRDDNGLPLDGNADLPVPEHWYYEEHTVRFKEARYHDQSIRLAYAWGAQDQAGTPYLALVAESNEHRQRLHHEILIGMLTPQFILVPLAALLAGLGLTHGLEPLNLLQARLRARSPNDLSPVDGQQAPAEIVPLIEAMNELLARQTASSAAHRRFVANAAHQLKTPLAGIRTQVELALKENDPSKINLSFEQLLRGSERATRLVSQMLMLARTESGELARWHDLNLIELNTLAEQQMIQWVPSAIARNIDLGLEPSPTAALIRGDSFMVGELLNNLLDNALLYTPAAGRVTLRIGAEEHYSWLEVEDSGPGIPVQYRHKVFDRFYRILGTEVDGSGLGLSIVKEIAEVHQAKVDILNSTLDSGTRIRVTFPPLPVYMPA